MIEMGKIHREDRISIYSDTTDDHKNHLFHGWAERFYVLYDQKIIYQGQKGLAEYSVPSINYFFLKTIFFRISFTFFLFFIYF
jgi:hypothetical protein